METLQQILPGHKYGQILSGQTGTNMEKYDKYGDTATNLDITSEKLGFSICKISQSQQDQNFLKPTIDFAEQCARGASYFSKYLIASKLLISIVMIFHRPNLPIFLAGTLATPLCTICWWRLRRTSEPLIGGTSTLLQTLNNQIVLIFFNQIVLNFK